MKKIVNFSTCKSDLDRFNYDSDKITKFMKEINVDGIELSGISYLDKNVIPEELITSVHLMYYPIWLDFWKNKKDALLKQFNTMENVKMYYGGENRQAIVDSYRKEIKKAEEIGAEYMVFHVAHVQLEHTYSYKFTYSDEEVIDATIELVNEIFKDFKCNVTLLFENLWWPGLTMLNKDMILRLINGVNYKNVGIMLDTAHLINTNPNIKSEEEAIDYILDTIKRIGDLKSIIKGIHLNFSLSGEYVKKINSEYEDNKLTCEYMNKQIYYHILNIDQHKPFTNSKIKQVVNEIKPEFLIYELISRNTEELAKYVQIQDKALRV